MQPQEVHEWVEQREIEKDQEPAEDLNGGKDHEDPGQKCHGGVLCHQCPDKVHGKEDENSIDDKHLREVFDTESFDKGGIGKIGKKNLAGQDEKHQSAGPAESLVFLGTDRKQFAENVKES